MFWLMLIHTFLAQAISPRFSINQYHKYLERGVTHTAQVMTMMPHQSFSNPNWKITTNSWISQNPTDFQEYLALPLNRRHSY